MPDQSKKSPLGLAGLFMWLLKPVSGLIASRAYLSLALAAFAIGFTFYSYQKNSDSIVLEELSIPAPLAAQGVTPESAADMIRQSLHNAARGAVATKGFKNIAQLEALPDIEVPGLSLIHI